MYAEDLDLCWSARDLGWTTWFESGSEFVHLGGTSSGSRWSVEQRAERVGQAEAELLRRHLSPARAGAALALIRAGVGVRWRLFALAGRETAAADAKGSWRGYGLPPAAPEGPADVGVEVLRPD